MEHWDTTVKHCDITVEQGDITEEHCDTTVEPWDTIVEHGDTTVDTMTQQWRIVRVQKSNWYHI